MLFSSRGKTSIFSFESKYEFFYLVLVCFLWFAGLNNIVMVIFDKLFHTDMFFRTDGKVIICYIILFFSLPFMGKKLRSYDYLFFLFIVILYLITYFLFSDENEFLDTFLNGFLLAVPMFLVGRSFVFSRYKKVFYLLSVAGIFISIYYNMFYIVADSYQGETVNAEEKMGAAYGLLTNTIFIIWYTFDSFSKGKILSVINIAISLVGVFYLLMMGTRGPVICIGLFIVYLLLFVVRPKNKALYRTSLIAVALLFFIFLEPILLYFSNLAYQLGFSERVFELFLTGSLASSEGSSGRTDYLPILFNALNKSPIWGYGFFGSYYYIHSYPHNIVIDLLFSFGYFFGGGFLILLLNAIIKSFKRISDSDESGFLAVLIGTGLLALLFSDTFVVSPYFFMCVGYSFQLASRKKALKTL